MPNFAQLKGKWAARKVVANIMVATIVVKFGTKMSLTYGAKGSECSHAYESVCSYCMARQDVTSNQTGLIKNLAGRTGGTTS